MKIILLKFSRKVHFAYRIPKASDIEPYICVFDLAGKF